MTRLRTRTSSALRGAAFGAACGASFWAVFLAFARYAAPTAQTEPVSCVQALRAEAPSPGPRSESAIGIHVATSAEAHTEAPAAQGKAARPLPASKAGALGHPLRVASGAGPAARPQHLPHRDPPRVPAAADALPNAGLALGDLQQQLPALLAQLTQGRSGNDAAAPAGNALSAELLEQLLGGH